MVKIRRYGLILITGLSSELFNPKVLRSIQKKRCNHNSPRSIFSWSEPPSNLFLTCYWSQLASDTRKQINAQNCYLNKALDLWRPLGEIHLQFLCTSTMILFWSIQFAHLTSLQKKKIRLSYELHCAAKCSTDQLANNVCNRHCNRPECGV